MKECLFNTFLWISRKEIFLKATTKVLLKIKPSSSINIEDEILYNFFIYMAIFGIDELSLDDFKSL